MRTGGRGGQSALPWHATAGLLALLSVQPAAAAAGKKGSCDDRIKLSFHPDKQTSVLLVKSFTAGEPVALANTPPTPTPPTAPVDVCLVKLLVGPGNPGSPGAPSTSPGIGIEVWLPTKANWNDIIRSYGSGGWAGGFHADVTRIGGTGAGDPIHLAAVGKGYVVSTSDHGHGGSGGDASFAIREDGSINMVLGHDFADGILAGAPAFNWTRFITAELYPQIVMLRDVGANIPLAKLHAVNAAAGAACGGIALGFLLNPRCNAATTRSGTRPRCA